MPISRRRYLFIYSVFVSLVALTSLGAIFLHAPEPDVAATTVQHSLASNKLSKDKSIFVHLPEGYDPNDEEKTYPVLYVLNRTENFNIASQIVDFLSSKGNIPEMIVVGIPHSGNSRSEYKPYETDSPSSRRVAVDALRAFLKSELVPFIDEAYHTKPSKILVGHSLAGLFTTDVFLNNPDLFNAYIALSPSYHHGPEIINAAERFMKRGQTSTNTVFYGNIGGDEFYRIFDHYHNMQSLFEKHAPVSIRWNMKEADNNSHRVMPLFGLYDALTTIYAGFNLSMPQFRNQQYEGVIAHYQKLSDEMGYKIKPTRDDLESLLGYFVNPDRASDPTVAEHANEYAKAAQKLLNYYYP